MKCIAKSRLVAKAYLVFPLLVTFAALPGFAQQIPGLGKSDGLYNVRDYGALNDGITDDTSAIQRAIDDASKTGGIVLIPVGRWLCKGHLELKMGVHLTGMNLAPVSWEPATGSILMPTEGRGNEDAPAFIEMRSSTSVNGLTIYYPEQKAADIQPYPWTIQIRGNPSTKSEVSFDSTIADVTLINSYNGIRTGPTENGRHRIIRVNGCVLRRGIFVDWTGDIGRIEDVQFHSHFWASKAFEGDWQKVFAFMQEHLEAFIFGRSDWEYVSNTFVFPASVGYKFVQTSNGTCNGQFSGIGADATGTAVLVEAIQVQGLLITNGEFDSHEVGRRTQIVIESTANGNVRFVNCGFWGPVTHNALIRGGGFVSFTDCYFSNDAETREYSVEVESGQVQIQNCTFGGDQKGNPGHALPPSHSQTRPPCIHLGSGVRSAIIRGNNGVGGVDIKNDIGSKAIISDNGPVEPATNR
jgi:Pectate lyase superfamily protein